MNIKPLLSSIMLSATVIAIAGCTTNSTTNANVETDTNGVVTNTTVATNTNTEQGTDTSLNDFITFTSQNEQLSFSYSPDWKCVEVVYDFRVDCYLKSRESEEYDAGLDQPIVYMPDITIWNENKDCTTTLDQKTIDNSPVQNVVDGVGITYSFYKKYNDCSVTVTTNSSIDSDDKLYQVIH